ncbi:MAG: hypothetical protein WCA22_09885 [Candidatus Binatus sp.]
MQEETKRESAAQFDLKKPASERSSKLEDFMSDPARNATTVVSEILGGIAAASAAAFQALSARLNEDAGNAGLPRNLADGLLDGNARFFDELAVAARHTADRLRSSPQSSATPEIDYERLADLVAERLRSTPRREQD